MLYAKQNNPEAIKKVQPSKVETIGKANLLATIVSDIRLRSSIIDYAKHKASYIEAVNNVKMVTVMCSTIRLRR